MNTNLSVSLNEDEIERLSSHYLSEGRKQESWKIKAVHIQGEKLSAIVTMRSTYVSSSDAHGFHLNTVDAVARKNCTVFSRQFILCGADTACFQFLIRHGVDL